MSNKSRELPPLLLASAWCAVILGISALIGWALNIDPLRNVLSGMPMMKPNAALSFSLIGAGILLMDRKRSGFCAAIVALIALASIAESLFGWNLQIDQLLFRDIDPVLGNAPPGRMALTTAVSFLILSVALFLLSRNPRALIKTPFLFGWMGSLLFGVALFSGTATWSGFTRGFPWEYWTSMALHGAGMFMFMGSALLWSAWRQSATQWQSSWLTASFVGGLALLAFIAGSANANNRELIRASEQITRLHSVLEALSRLEASVDQQERSVYRILLGFGSVEQVRRMNEEVERQFQKLRSTLGDSASERYAAEFNARMEEFAQFIGQLAPGLNDANRLEQSEILTQGLRTLVSQIQREQEAFLRGYAGQAQDFARRTLLLIPVSSFLSMMMLASAFFLLSSEIANRQKAMEQLRWGEERFRSLANSIPQLTWIAEADGNITWYNQRWYEYTGTNEAQMREHGWAWLVEPRSLARLDACWLGAVRAGVAYEEEVPIRRFDGSYRRFLTRALPLRNQAGEILQWFGTCTDMEDYRRAMAELQRKEFELSLSQQLGRIGTFDWDIPNNRIYWSPELEALYGLPANAFGGRYEDWRKAVHPEDIQEAERRVEESMHSGTLVGEWRALLPDGTIRWMGARASVNKDDQGNPQHMIGANFDVTEIKQAEEQIRRFNVELEQRVTQRTAQLKAANEELESFTYSVSHDLRAPLRAIDGFSRMLLDEHSTKLDEEGQRMLGIVRAESQRMGQLIDDLLTFSRLGRQSMESQPVDMQGLVQSVVKEVLTRYPQRQVRLELDPLPVAHGQPNMLRQVWVNLFDNAVKFTKGAEPAIISISGQQEGTELIYCIRDNGVGFDMRFASKLFGVFQRLHSQSEFSGTGVGLALVKRIVQRHGGRVWAESELGQGACFYFALPNNMEEVAV